MTKSRQQDQLLYVLMAVIFTAFAVLTIRNLQMGKSGQEKPAETARVSENVQTPDELMRELGKTVDDGGKSEVGQIESETSGL